MAVEPRWKFSLEQRVKHCRNAVNSRAALVRYGLERRWDIEYFGRIHNFAAMSDNSEKAKYQAKAVKERWRTAEYIFRG
jgi:hypothetical protein